MILSRRVALGGTQLDSLHRSIVIRGIDTGVPKETINAVNRMGGSGQRVTGQHWETMDVSVTFAIDIPHGDMAGRRTVWDSVMKWAMAGGWLTVGHMTGKRLYVDKAILPGSGDLFNWTDDYTITFRAYNVPFWQDATATTVTETVSTSGSLSLTVPGNVKTVMDFSFKNTSGSNVSDLSVTAGGNTIQLSGISLANNATVSITHGTDGLLRILKGSTSVYDKYTGADDLVVSPGSNTVSITASGGGQATATVYGRYV